MTTCIKKKKFQSIQQRDLRIILSNQQRDLRKISFQSVEGPEEDINSIQQRDLRKYPFHSTRSLRIFRNYQVCPCINFL
jgi:hypothetical protein